VNPFVAISSKSSISILSSTVEKRDLRGIDRDAAAGRDVLFGRAQNRRYPSQASRTEMAMQKQKMNVLKTHEKCTFKREKKTPELFSSFACESQLGCIVKTSVVFTSGFDSGVPMTDSFEPHSNLKFGNGHTVPFLEEYQNTWMWQVGLNNKYGSRNWQQIPGHCEL
jgi:hypothetical protein